MNGISRLQLDILSDMFWAQSERAVWNTKHFAKIIEYFQKEERCVCVCVWKPYCVCVYVFACRCTGLNYSLFTDINATPNYTADAN